MLYKKNSNSNINDNNMYNMNSNEYYGLYNKIVSTHISNWILLQHVYDLYQASMVSVGNSNSSSNNDGSTMVGCIDSNTNIYQLLEVRYIRI